MIFLIIDDEPDDRKLAIRYLKKEFPDAEFIEIFTQKQFYDALEEKNFDFVITDYQLHWANGIKILKEVKKRNPFLPVIMLTGTGTEEIAVEALKAGLDDYVVKTPEHFMKLPAAVKVAIEKAKINQQEKMLASIVENAKEAVISLDENGNIIYANKAIEEIFGWKREEIIGKPASILAIDKREQKEQLDEAIKKGGAKFETVRKDRHGNEIPVLLTIVPFRDEKGNLLFSSEIMRDIREIKEYEKRVEHLNEVLRAIRNINQLITKEKGTDKLLQETCRTLFKIRGYEVTCISHEENIYTAGNKKDCEELQRYVKEKEIEDKIEKESKEFLYEFKNKYLLALPLIKNGIQGILYVLRSKKFDEEEIRLLKEVGQDIAFAIHSVKLEKELKEERETVNAILSASPVGIGFSINRTIGWANETMYKMVGYTPEETLGKSTIILYESDEEYERVGREIEKAFKKGRMVEIETKWKRKDGSVFDCYLRICPINPKKPEEGIVVVAMDVTERKRLEKELKESEERFRQFFENAPEYCYMISTDGKILDVNKSALKALGYKKEELVGKSLFVIYSPSSREKAKKLFTKWKKTGRLRNEELKIITKDGEERTVLLSADAVRDEKGNIIHSISIQRDITELKEMEDALRESEEKYRTLADNIPAGVFIVYNREVIYLNKKAEEMLRREKDAKHLYVMWKKDGKLPIDAFFNLWKKEKREKVMNVFEKGLKEKKLNTVELKTSGNRHLLFYVTTIKYKGEGALLGIVQDITELRKTEERLRESEEKFRSLVENADDAIYIITPEGFEYINPAFEKLTGYSRKEILNKGFNFWNLIHPEDIELIRKRRKARIKGEEIAGRYEFRIITRDGKIKNVESSTVPLEKRRTLGIMRDVTERKKAEEMIRKLCDLHYVIGMSINRSSTIKELCKNILKHIREIIEIDHTNIFIYEEENNILKPIAHYGYPEDFAKRVMKSYIVDEKQPWEAVKSFLEKKERYVKDVKKHEPLSFNWDLYRKYDATELYTLPLITKNKVYGILQVLNTSSNPLTEDKRKLLKSIAEEIAAGIAKIKAEEETRRALEQEREFKLRAAHYFFNPIAIAKGYLELILEEEGENEKILKAIEAINRVEKVVKNVTQRGEIVE